jgi:hypothetical protein
MKNGKELYCPKGRRGSKGEPAVPPKLSYKSAFKMKKGVRKKIIFTMLFSKY